MTLGNYLRIAARVMGPPADAAMPMWARSTSIERSPPEHSIKPIPELYIYLFTQNMLLQRPFFYEKLDNLVITVLLVLLSLALNRAWLSQLTAATKLQQPQIYVLRPHRAKHFPSEIILIDNDDMIVRPCQIKKRGF